MAKVDIMSLMYSQFVKYDKLVEIVNKSCSGSNASTAYLYIDLNSLLKNVFRNVGNLEIGNYTSLTSAIINMVIHYRWFFKTRYQTECKVILVFSYNYPPENRSIMPGYNEQNYQLFCHSDMMTEILDKNLELLRIICGYLDGTYFCALDAETGVIIKSVMNVIYMKDHLDSKAYQNFVITKDPYNYQLVSDLNTIIIRPKIRKFDGMSVDASYWISHENVWQTILSERAIQYNLPITLDSSLISLVYAVSGIQQRRIYATIPIKKALQTIQSLIDNYIIPNHHPGFTSNTMAIIYANSSKKRAGLPMEMLLQTKEVIDMINAFKVIDIAYQFGLLSSTSYTINFIPNMLIDLHDPNGLKEINDKYFGYSPIDFQRY